MPISGLDFGLFIAYFIPGLVTLWVVAPLVPALQRVFERLDDEKRFGAVLAIAVLALVTGMIVSIVRAGTLDHTFEIAYPLDCNGDRQFGSVGRVDPDYSRLADEGRREAFLLAVAQEKRLYQFYGNLLLSILLVSISVLATGRMKEMQRRPRMVVVVLTLCVLIALYGGARMSHYRFMNAVASLNGGVLAVSGSDGRPCREAAAPHGPGSRAR